MAHATHRTSHQGRWEDEHTSDLGGTWELVVATPFGDQQLRLDLVVAHLKIRLRAEGDTISGDARTLLLPPFRITGTRVGRPT